MVNTIDINADVGESFYKNKSGNDEFIIPQLSSCNIACGFHGGDPLTIKNTVTLASQNNVTIGAHPSFYDLENFGRKDHDIDLETLQAQIEYQLGALQAIVKSQGTSLKYVKAHGALYHKIHFDPTASRAFIQAVKNTDSTLSIIGMPIGILKENVELSEHRFFTEAFLDRSYEDDLSLTPRQFENAVLSEPKEIDQRLEDLLINKCIHSRNGKKLELIADTLCIHGDSPKASMIVEHTLRFCTEHNITIKPFCK